MSNSTLAPAHVIRLRGPWEYRPLFRLAILPGGSQRRETCDLPAAGRIAVPGDWGATLGADFRGRVAYRRPFGCPTGLAAADRVDLVIERVDAYGRALLNGQSLGEIPAGGCLWRREITAGLRPRNELVVEVELPGGDPPPARPGREDRPGGLVGEVRLEIFTAADAG